MIYFTDASSRYQYENYMTDVLTTQPNGAVYSYDPQNKKVSLVKDKLYFANGIAIEEGGDSVLVSETIMYRVTRIWVAGPKKGQSEVVIDNLPGTPDNIKFNEKG